MTKPYAKPAKLVLQPHKNRLKQVSRNGRAKRFDAKRRAVFLEWFAATCNVKLAAEQADIDRTSVYRHRRTDTAFAEAWDEALAQGYAALEASLLADAITSEADQPQDEEADELAPPPDEQLSFEQRMALLKEYRRIDGAHGPRAVGKAPAIQPRIASPAEAEAALIRRLKHFTMRVAEADAEGRSLLGTPLQCAKCGVPITKSGSRTT